ncbi:MAG: PAS domain S-box protein [Bacteroidales bacterium]|nr:PAS domain S-box protein [Bacteroidales bacterium]
MNKTKVSNEFGKLERIISNVNLGTWEWHINTDQTYFNERWANIVGYSLDELEPTNIEIWKSLTHPYDLQKSIAELEKLFNGEIDTYECEIRMKHKKGHWVWVKDIGNILERDRAGQPLIISGIHQDITNQKESQLKLTKMLDYEKVLRKISERFNGLYELDTAINISISELGEISKADRTYIFLLRPDEVTMDNTHEWCKEGVNPEKENLQELPVSIFPWWFQKLKNGELILVDDVTKMPEEAQAEREILEAQNISGVAVLPLTENGKVMGFIGFDNVHEPGQWPEEDLNLLRTCAEIMQNAITRNRYESKIHTSERKFKDIFDNHRAMQAIIEPTLRKINEVNQALLDYTGYKREELVDRVITNFIDLSEDQLQLITDSVRNQKISHIDFGLRSKNGTTIDFKATIAAIHINETLMYHIVLVDNSLNIKLEKDNLLLREALNYIQTSIAIINSDESLLYCNKSFIENFDLKSESSFECKNIFFDVSNPNQFNEVWEHLNKGHYWEKELERVPKAGEPCFESVRSSPVLNNQGELQYVIVIINDITNKKNLERNIIEAKDRAEESARAKSAFLAVISHELRTPLNHIIGFSEILQSISEDQETQEFASLIKGSGDHLLEIIEDIFELALTDQGNVNIRNNYYKLLDIYAELRNNFQEIFSKSGKNDSIKLEFKPEPMLLPQWIFIDKGKLIIILQSLFKNALKFTHSGSIKFGFNLTTKQEINFWVSDTGIGIPENKLETIFEFFTLVDDSHTRSYEGLGIGLTICKRLTEAMGGQIRVASVEGEGSTFYIRLPFSRDENSYKVSHEEANILLPNLTGKTILIVEDDFTSMRLIENLILKTNAKTIKAFDGQQAVDKYRLESNIDLVLMDLKLPVMDGFQATKDILNYNPTATIIALTAYALTKDRDQALDSGCKDIVTKPINKALLFNKIKQFLLK